MRSGPRLRLALVLLLVLGLGTVMVQPVGAQTASAPTRLGYKAGDDWEPSVAADNYGHVYAFWTHYNPVCFSCFTHLETMQISSDSGATWGAPFTPVPSSTSQDDPQVVVDPVDGRTVYASYMQGSKSSQYVAKSTDFGKTWHTVLVESLQRGTDKDVLAVHGQDVYLVYNAVMKIYASVSHDGGKTWGTHLIVSNTNSKLGWSLPGGGVVDSKGNAYFSWEGFTQNGKPSGLVHIYISKSTDGGKTWTVTKVDTSQAPPICSTCGWAYWGPGTSMGVDTNDELYLLYNANSVKFGPNRVYFVRSGDGGATWSHRLDVSMAPRGANNLFPAIAASRAGDVRIAWMDDRNGYDNGLGDGTARWNEYYRTSMNGGSSFSREQQISQQAPGYSYSFSSGFNEPYGDYQEMSIDSTGRTHLVWGEGPNYNGPGNVWYWRS